MVQRIEVAGMPISLLNMDLACREVERCLGRDRGSYFIFRDMNGVVLAARDAGFLQAHRAADFVAPDGMPFVWLARLLGFRHVGRVYGPDFLLEFCRRTEGAPYRHYFYGSTEGVIAKLAAR